MRAVVRLARHYGRRPDRISEEEVRRYLIDLVEVQHAARGTYLYKSDGIRFFYVQTLGVDWNLFSKKKTPLAKAKTPTPPHLPRRPDQVSTPSVPILLRADLSEDKVDRGGDFVIPEYPNTDNFAVQVTNGLQITDLSDHENLDLFKRLVQD